MPTTPSKITKRWGALSPRAKQVLIGAAAAEGALKIAALVDLLRRPPEQVNGRKAWWATAIVLVNSAGAVPIAYFLRGRRR